MRILLTEEQRTARRAYRAQQAARQAARVQAVAGVQKFFVHSFTQAAVVMALLAVFGFGFGTQAQNGVRTYRAAPTSCSGWTAPERATTIDLLGSSGVGAFGPDTSATIRNRTPDAPAPDPQMRCKAFALPLDFPENGTIRNIELILSLAVRGNAESEDAVVIESSLDGQEWKTLESFFVTEDTSNEHHGGFRRYPFAALNQDNLGSLQVRVRFVTVPSNRSVEVLVDGLALEVESRLMVSAEALRLPANVVQVEKKHVSTTEEPVLKVEVEKQARLKFLGFKDTKRSIDAVQVNTAEGTVVAAGYDVQNITEGGSTFAKLNIHTDNFTKPGTYTAQVTVLQDNKLAVVTTEFTWGVLVLNMNRSVYWPGETVQFGMGVLDPEGHTICDARLELTVVAPDGSTTVQTTEQTEKGVRRSSTCGPDNVTDVADYSADYETYDAGNYAVKLTAKTASGEYTITDTVVVNAVIPFAISRRGSMRIYPPAAYTMAIDVRPQKDFRGVVEDYVPPSFDISKVSDGGTVIQGQQRTTIRWNVDWTGRTTHTLTYRYDAPDISPEIFRLGPVQVGDYQESRQWQIASDAVGGQSATRLFTIGFETQTPGGSNAASTSSGGPMEYTSNVNAPVADTSTYRSGAASLETLITGSPSTEGAMLSVGNANTLDDFYFRAYIYISTLPSARTQVMLIEQSTGGDLASIQMNTDGTLELWNDEDAGQIGSDSAALSTGVWYRLEMRVDCTSTCAGVGSATVDGRIDGTSFASSTTVSFATGFRDFKWGILQSATAEFNWDDIAVNNDSTNATDQNWPGPGKVVTLRPSGDGTNTAWTDATGGDNDGVDYEEINTLPGVDTTYVNCTTTSQLSDYTLDNPSGITAGDSIRIVQPNVRHVTSGTGAHIYTIALYVGATDNDLASVSTNQSTNYQGNDDVYTTTSVRAPTPPNVNAYDYPGTASTTNDAWTLTNLNDAALQIGSSTDCTPNTRITEIWVNVEYNPREGGRLWTSGFELGIASPPAAPTAGMEITANVGSPEIVTSTKRYGAYALRANQTSTTEGASYTFATADTADDFYARAYVNFTTRPNSNAKILVFQDNAASDQASIRFDNSNNTLELWNEEDNVQVGSDSTAIATGTWYMLELKIDATTIGSTVLGARLDNVEFATNTVSHANGVKTLAFGAITTTTTSDAYWDDLAINQGIGATQNTYPGPGAVVHFQPDANGDNTAWTNTYTNVDEVPPNDATDVLTSSTVNQVEDNNMESASSAGIGTNDRVTLAAVGVRFNLSTAGTQGAIVVRLKDNASVGHMESYPIPVNSTTWYTNGVSLGNYPLTAYDRPNLSSSWTPSQLDTVQTGVRLFTDPSTNNFQVTNLWLLVEYIPQITLSLTTYDDSETSTGFPCNILNVKLEVVTNGGPTRTANNTGTEYKCTASDGTYTTLYADAPNNVGDPIVISSSTILTSTTVLLANSTTAAISGIEIRDKQLMLMKDNSATITNAILAKADNGDADIMYTVSSSNITLTSGQSVLVGKSGTAYTYDPGGSVTTTSGVNGGDFHVNNGSTAYLDTATNVIGRDILVDDGSTLHIDANTTVSDGDITTSGTSAVVDYSTGTPKVTMNGSSGNIGGGTTPTITFYDLEIYASTTISLTSQATINHDLRAIGAASAVFNVNANLWVGNNVTMSGGAIITTTSGTPTVTLTCTDATCDFGTSGQTGTFKVYNLSTSGSGTITYPRSFTLAGDLSIGTGTTFTYSGTPVLTTHNTKAFSGVGTLTLYDLQVAESGTTASTTVSLATTIYGSITIGAGATNGTLTMGANITHQGVGVSTATSGSVLTYSGTPTFYSYANASNTVSGSGTMSFYAVNIGSGTQNWFIADTTMTIAGGVTVNDSTSSRFRPSGNGNVISIAGGLTCTGTGGVSVYSGTPTVTFTATQTLNCSTTMGFGHVTSSGSSTITQSTAMTLSGDLTVGSSSTWRANANVTVSGGDVTGDGTLTYTSGTPTFSVNGTGNFGGATGWTFYKLDFINTGNDVTTTATGAGGITINNQLFTRLAGDGEFVPFTYHTLLAGSKTWTLTASGSGGSAPFQNESGQFQGQTSTFLYTGTSATDIAFANNTTTNYYYNLHLIPASDVTVTYKLTSLVVNNNLNMGRTGTILDSGVLTVDAATNDPNITVGATLSCNSPSGENSTAITLGANTWTVGNFNTSSCWGGITYDTGSTVKMNLAGGTITNVYNLYNLNIDPSSAGTVTSASTHNVYGTLTVASGDSYSINASRATYLQSGAAEIAGTGTITGSGKIGFLPTSSGPGTTVTINAITVYSVSAAVPSTTFDARTYGNDVEITNTTSSSYVVTCASGTYTLSGSSSDLLLLASGTGNVTLDCSANNPTWNIGGNLDYTGAGGGSESITTGTDTWTVSGNVDFTAGTVTATSGHTLVMDGSSKTLTTNSQTLQNATLSGTITLANSASHTFNGNLTLSGTVTCSTLCTVAMTGTANTIAGGGNTLGNLSIDPTSTGTITLQTSDLILSGTSFAIATGDTLAIASGRTLTVGLLSLGTTINGTLNGPGRLIYQDNGNTFPTGGTLGADLILRFDAFNGNLTLPVRTDYQYVEIDNSSTTAGRTVTPDTGTITVNDNLDILNTGTGSSTTIFNLDTSDPTFTVTGNTAVAADATLTAPSGGALNLGGNYANSGTFTDSGGTVTLNGTGTQTLSGTMISGSDFNNLVITNSSGSVTGCGTSFTPGVAFAAAATISGTYTITTAGVKVQYNSGSTYTGTNINWVGGSGNLIYFRNSNLSSGTWLLNVSGTQTVQYVDVARSDASPGNDIDADDGTNNDCTGNTGWIFVVSGIDISGTSDGSSGTVKVAVNGSIQGQTTTLASNWTITGVTVSTGNVVTVFVDAVGESAETTGVTIYDGTGNIGGLVLNANVLTIGSDDNASLALTDLGGIDNDDNENIMHTANASTLTVDGGATYSTEQITIKASNTLTIGTSETLATHHVNNAGTLVGTGSATFNVFGNWTNSSTFTHNTSTVNFKATGTGKTINNGASSFYNVVFDGSGGAWSPLTNTMTVTNNLTLTNGTFDTATGTANVVVNGNVQCGASCGTINMTSTNTFTQSVATSKAFGTNVAVGTNWTFYNLTFTAASGTPTITFNGTGTGQIIIGATLSTTNSGTSLVVDNETNDRTIDANGAVTIGSGTTFQASSTAAFTVAGNWTNNGDFTDGSGTVTLDGASQQTVDGQLTGASDRFNDLTVTNTSGSDPETSPSVIFAASADVADDFTASTANTKIRFLAGGTFTFQKITFNGGAVGTRVALRSSTPGTSWALNVAGARAVSYTDVRDSNACGQAPNIAADDGTSFDSAGNSCWDINTLTFAINDVAVGFGTLSPTGARWASADATGSGSAVAAHTLAVTTNARNGYVLSYFGPTLVGPDTIDAATFTGDADGTPGSEQFAMSITTDGDGTIPSAYQKSSNNYSFVPSTTTTLMSETGPTAIETASVYYLCNVAAITRPGAYSTSVTYVLTSTF